MFNLSDKTKNRGLQKGNISFGSFVLMLTLIFLSLFDGGLDSNIIYPVLILLVFASIYLLNKYKVIFKIDFRHPFFWFLLFLGWAGISIFWSINPYRTLVEFLEISCYGLVFFLTVQQDEDNLFSIGRMVFLLGIFIGLFGIAQYLFLDTGRIRATFSNSNPLGIFLAMIFLLGWGFYLRSPSKKIFLGSLIILIALALTGSRGSFISLFIALPLIFWGFKRKQLIKPIQITVTCIIVALLITQGIMLVAPYLQDAIGTGHQLSIFLTRPESFIASSGVGRFAYWNVGGQLALNEPLQGYGLGTFYLAYPLEHAGDNWYARFAHNHYIQTASELGVLGLIFLGGFLFSFLKTGYNKLQKKEYPPFFPGIIAASVAFLIHIGVDFSWNFPGTAVVFFALVGAVVGGKKVSFKSLLPFKRFSIHIFLILILLLTLWKGSANIFYHQAIQLDLAGNVSEAARVYSRVNSFFPINPMAYSFEGRNYFILGLEKGDRELIEKAIRTSQKAVSISPVDGNLHNNLGRLYREIGDLEQAEYHFLLALEYAIFRLDVFLDLGVLYMNQGNFEKAEMVLQEGVSRIDIAIRKTGSEEEKEQKINQAVNLHLLLARIYADNNEQQLVEDHLEEARILNPQHPGVKDFFENEE